MFELAWPWVFALLPLPWLARLLLPAADSGEPVLKVGFLNELEGLAGRRARLNLPTRRQQAPFVVIWLLLLCAAARPQWLGEPVPIAASGRDLLVAVDVRVDGLPRHAVAERGHQPPRPGQGADGRLPARP